MQFSNCILTSLNKFINQNILAQIYSISIYIEIYSIYNLIFFVKLIVNKDRKLSIIEFFNSVVTACTINKFISYFATTDKTKKKEIYLYIKYKAELEKISNYSIKNIQEIFVVVQLLTIKSESQIKKEILYKLKKIFCFFKSSSSLLN